MQAKSPKVIAFASGRGGVGKSSMSLLFAHLLSRSGCRVLIVDADLALGNLHLLAGVEPKFNLFHVLSGRVSIEQALISVSESIDLLAASTGNQWMANLIPTQHFGLIQAISQMNRDYDFVLIDTGSGISNHVTAYLHACPHVVLLTTPDLSGAASAYSVMKVIKQQKGDPQFHLLVNHHRSNLEGSDVFARISKLTEKFLGTSFDYMGQIPEFPKFNQQLSKLYHTESIAVPSWVNAFEVPITQMLRWSDTGAQGSVQFFFERALGKNAQRSDPWVGSEQ